MPSKLTPAESKFLNNMNKLSAKERKNKPSSSIERWERLKLKDRMASDRALRKRGKFSSGRKRSKLDFMAG